MLSRGQGQGAAWSGASLAALMWLMGGAGLAQADWRTTSGLTVSGRYDDNVRFSSTNKTGDFGTVVTPTFDFKGRAQEVDVSGHLSGSYTLYAKNTDLDRMSSLGGVSVNADALTGRALPGWKLTVADNYNYTQEFPAFAQLGQTDGQASGGVQTGRFSTLGNTATALTSYALTSSTQLTGGLTNSMTHFSSGSSLTNNTTNILTGGWSHAISALTSILGDYTFSKFKFSSSTDGASSSTDTHTDTHAVHVGVRQRFFNDLDVDAKVGGTYLPALDRLTYNYDAGLTKKFPATDVGGRISRFVGSSGGLAALVSTRDIFSLFLSHRVNASLTAALTANYSSTKSVGITTVDITSNSFGPTVTYRLTRWATLTASYAYFHQKSEGTVGSDVQRGLATVGVTVTWP